jgi:hypothetical protein
MSIERMWWGWRRGMYYVLCTMYLSVVVDEEFGTEEIIKLSLGLAFAGRGIGSQLQNARVALR